jgi:hypothetical protein
VELSQVRSGLVFRWPHDERPQRVLVHDRDRIAYDCWWPHLKNWGYADLEPIRRGRANYYGVNVATLLAKAAFVGNEPLTDEEAKVHRPDLPITVVQRAGVSWPVDVVAARAWAEQFRGGGIGGVDGADLQVTEVYLSPFGPKGATKGGVRVRADNGMAFTAEELMRKAAEIQAKATGKATSLPGVGIYRLGLNRLVPSFWLWGETTDASL